MSGKTMLMAGLALAGWLLQCFVLGAIWEALPGSPLVLAALLGACAALILAALCVLAAKPGWFGRAWFLCLAAVFLQWFVWTTIESGAQAEQGAVLAPKERRS